MDSSPLVDSTRSSRGASKYLADLPSRGLFSSSGITSNLGSMRVYVCDHNTSPPEDQLIRTNSTNILIRALTLKKQKGESSAKDGKITTATDAAKKRMADRTRESKVPSKKTMNSSALAYDADAASSSNRAEPIKNLQGLTVERLRALLKDRGLSPKGKKEDLIARLSGSNN